jgi:hypothetical protein
MKRLGRGVLLAGVALSLVACGPDQFVVDCEAGGGRIEHETEWHLMAVPVFNGTTTTIQMQLRPFVTRDCVLPR